MINGLSSLESYALSKGLPVEDVVRGAALGKITLCWQLETVETMRSVAEYCPCLTESQYQREGTVWRGLDCLTYGKPPARLGLFRLKLSVNPVLGVIFRLLAQGRSPYSKDIEVGDCMVRDSLVIQDLEDGSWWRILGDQEGFEGGRLPYIGELIVELETSGAAVNPALFKPKSDVQLEMIRRWFDQQIKFTKDQLFNPQSGLSGAKRAAWEHFEAQGLARAGELFYSTPRAGKGSQSRAFEGAWSRFKAEMLSTTPQK